MALLLEHTKVTHEKIGPPDQISIPQDKSPYAEELQVELS